MDYQKTLLAQQHAGEIRTQQIGGRGTALSRLTDALDQWATTARILSICLGIIYLWFGMLKFFPGLSPAEEFAKSTVSLLTFQVVPGSVSIILLAMWEVLIGVMFLTLTFPKFAARFALVHILCTFSPLVLQPELAFTQAPYGLTLAGQYIIKNVLIVGALVVLLRQKTQ